MKYRIDVQGRILIPVADVVPNIITKCAYNSSHHKGAIPTDRRGGNGHPASIIYDGLTKYYKRKISAVYGDPYVVMKIKSSKAKRRHYISSEQLIGILKDIAKIEDKPLRIRLINTLTNL